MKAIAPRPSGALIFLEVPALTLYSSSVPEQDYHWKDRSKHELRLSRQVTNVRRAGPDMTEVTKAGIKISPSLVRALPAAEREGLEDFLWAKSAGNCSLCDDPLNRASDQIEADHVIAEAEGGPNSRDNLYLAHVHCNRSKRNFPSVDVAPYLRLDAFVRRNDYVVNYAGTLPYFGIKPAPTVVTVAGDRVTFEFPDGSTRASSVFDEKPNRGQTIQYTFVDVPPEAIFNDEVSQPRTIKMPQIWKIYADLQRNPLHEPPSCRLLKLSESDHSYELSMFDGQHKTVASWMAGRKRVVSKIYLEMSDAETIALVNSIQYNVPKLVLSPFELTAKLADEWRFKLQQYEEQAKDTASEKGFVAWLSPGDRTRYRAAFRAALIQTVWDADDLKFKDLVLRAGIKDKSKTITEAVFKTKVLERLLHLQPLDEVKSDADHMRARERDDVIEVLNILVRLAFEPAEGAAEQTAREKERKRRISYQSSLAYIAHLLTTLTARVLKVDEERAFLDKDPTAADWQDISEGIKRLLGHPAWEADFSHSEKMKAIEAALSKNQEASQAFRRVGLRPGYVLGDDKLDSDALD